MVARILPETLRRSDGSQLSFRILGTGRPVVGIPGGPGMSASYLTSFANRMTDQLQWYLIDPPGTGDTTPSDDGSIGSLATFYAGAAAELGLTSYLIMGHSHGATVATTMAFRRPHRSNGLLLVAPPVIGSRADAAAGGHVQAAAASALARHQDQPWYEEAMKAEFAGGIHDGGGSRRRSLPLYFSHPTVELIVTAWTVLATPNMNEEAFVRFYEEEWESLDLRPLLPHISCPVLAIAGEHDWAVPPPQARMYGKLCDNAQVAVLPDCGHFPQLESGEMLATTITDWLIRHDFAL